MDQHSRHCSQERVKPRLSQTFGKLHGLFVKVHLPTQSFCLILGCVLPLPQAALHASPAASLCCAVPFLSMLLSVDPQYHLSNEVLVFQLIIRSLCLPLGASTSVVVCAVPFLSMLLSVDPQYHLSNEVLVFQLMIRSLCLPLGASTSGLGLYSLLLGLITSCWISAYQLRASQMAVGIFCPVRGSYQWQAHPPRRPALQQV